MPIQGEGREKDKEDLSRLASRVSLATAAATNNIGAEAPSAPDPRSTEGFHTQDLALGLGTTWQPGQMFEHRCNMALLSLD